MIQEENSPREVVQVKIKESEKHPTLTVQEIVHVQMDTPRDALLAPERGRSENLYLNVNKRPVGGTTISIDDVIFNPSTYGHPFEETPRYMIPKGFV